MAKHTLKILCEHHKIFKVCLAILQYDDAWKGETIVEIV